MTIALRLFLTNEAFQRAVDEAARRQIEPQPEAVDPAWLVKLYSENPTLLRRALAAYWGVSVEALDKRNVSDTSPLMTPFKRALCAYADGLAEMRAEAS